MSLLEPQAKDSFGMFRSLAVALDLMSSMVVKHVPFSSIFRLGNSRKSLGARSRECGGWVMIGMSFLAMTLRKASDEWLGELW
jgi:hypothetical protein